MKEQNGQEAGTEGGARPVAPDGRPLTARGQRTRQKLLEAAEAVFGEKTYEHASIAEITQRAGVALGTFYIYFPDKLTVFVKLVDDLGQKLRKSIRAATEGLDHRLEVEREGFKAFLKFVAQHRSLYRIVRQSEFVEPTAFKRYYQSLGEGYAKGLRRAAEKHQVADLDPEVLAYSLMGIADFLGMRYVLWGEDGVDLEKVVETAMKMINRGIEPQSK